MEKLTITELKNMHGEPVWCDTLGCWGLVVVDDCGKWEGIPFLLGHQGCQFLYNIESRDLVLYRECLKDVPIPCDSDHPQYKALEYLYKELRRERTGLGRAEKRPGHTDEEIRNIHRKIDILEYIIGIVTAKGEE